jgi:hypothetical protein
MSLELCCHLQTCNDEIGADFQELCVSANVFLVASVHDGIRVHLDDPVDQLEVEFINFAREVLVFLYELGS